MITLAPNIIAGAQSSFGAWKVPASISLAQFGDESEWGQKVTGNYNYFGIKAVPGQPFTMCPTHEERNGHYMAVMQPFANYPTPYWAFMAHAQLLATHPAYAPFMAAVARGDIEGACNALTGVYATGLGPGHPTYGQVLIDIIKSENLTRYDPA